MGPIRERRDLKMKRKKLTRRRFIETGSAGLIGLASLPKLTSFTFAQNASASSRRIYPLNHIWLFSEKNLPNATKAGFNDAAFKRVTIPHTNRMLPWHGFDDKEYEFVSVYRRHFRPPAELQGRRVFIDFGGAMTASTVWINGQRLGEYRGGYTPFSFELTPHLNWRGDNVLAVEVDSTERKDVPPFGNRIDYLTFGGIYRDVELRFVNPTFIENVFARPADVLSDADRRVRVRCYLDETKSSGAPLELYVDLLDRDLIATQLFEIKPSRQSYYDFILNNFGKVDLWKLDQPKLYTVRLRLKQGGQPIDQYETRIGFREANFTPEGFYLNGKHLKLRGLNRHQTFPYVGQAMPARVQKRDAWILRKELHCNIVRTSHYPQSPHFLDACDEYGLLVFEEIPGWIHIGNSD